MSIEILNKSINNKIYPFKNVYVGIWKVWFNKLYLKDEIINDLMDYLENFKILNLLEDDINESLKLQFPGFSNFKKAHPQLLRIHIKKIFESNSANYDTEAIPRLFIKIVIQYFINSKYKESSIKEVMNTFNLRNEQPIESMDDLILFLKNNFHLISTLKQVQIITSQIKNYLIKTIRINILNYFLMTKIK